MPNHYDDGEYKGSEHATDVFKAPPKEQTEGEKLEESGEYLQDPETVDTSQPLESKSFEIDPNKNTPTKREKEREDRLRQRAGSGQQGADIAKKKLPPEKQTDLPQFLQTTNEDIQSAITKQGQLRDAQKNQPFDDEMGEFRKVQDQLTPREKIDWLLKNKHIKDGIINALKSQGVKKITKAVLRRAAQGYLTWSLMR